MYCLNYCGQVYFLHKIILIKLHKVVCSILKIGVDAEMVGRGEAGISSVKGVSAMFWNPAGLAELEDHEFLFSHNAWIADISMNAISCWNES